MLPTIQPYPFIFNYFTAAKKNKPVSQLKENFPWYAHIPCLERKGTDCQTRTLQKEMNVTRRAAGNLEWAVPRGAESGLQEAMGQKDLL